MFLLLLCFLCFHCYFIDVFMMCLLSHLNKYYLLTYLPCCDMFRSLLRGEVGADRGQYMVDQRYSSSCNSDRSCSAGDLTTSGIAVYTQSASK